MTHKTWLVFRDGEHKLRRFLKKGFGHVSYLMCDKHNWILLNPANNKLEIEILPYPITDNIPLKLGRTERYTVLQLLTEDKKVIPLFPRWSMGFTCVTFVKYCMGMKCWPFTPYQLYKHLLYNKRTKGVYVFSVKELTE